MNKVVFFHRNLRAGYSINKVIQTLIKQVHDKEEYYAPYYRITFKSLIKNLIFIYKNRTEDGINHITGDIHYGILALRGCKSVLTVHDTTMYDNCQSYFKRLIFYYLWLKWPLRLATRVICISNATKVSVERFTDRKDIEVIHNSIDQMFEERIPIIDEKLPYINILMIGTNHNKNLLRTFDALNGLECKITIIGKLNDEQLASINNNHIDYINRYDLTDDEIYDEYCRCDFVSFCSTYEGFGMPIIEANYVGKPVICSDMEPLKEVAGNSALFVNPYDVKNMRDGFVKMIHDKALRDDLIKRGKANALRFSPEKVYYKYLEVYNSLG